MTAEMQKRGWEVFLWREIQKFKERIEVQREGGSYGCKWSKDATKQILWVKNKLLG